MTETGNITKIKNVQERLKEHESRFECDNEGIEEIDNATIEVIKNDLILLKDVEINKDILKQTKIGVTVNKFTKINNESIKNISKELVDKWKNIAIKEKNTNKDLENIKKRKHNETENSNNNVNEKGPELKKKGTSNSLNNSNSTHINEDKENNGKNSTKSYAYNSNENRKINIVDIEEMQKWNYNGKYHHDALRDKAKQFLFKAFITGSHDNLLHLIDRNKLDNIIYNIENELYKIFIEKKNSQKEYNMQLKSIKFNLSDKKNPNFNEKIYAEYISARTLATMNSQDMASDEKKNERQKCLQESLLACQSDWDVKNILLKKERKGEFQCFKCKGYDTVYQQLQTRSSDEPMTTFVTCLKCNNRWKF
ncbi:transcription elongation factor s-II, putative [Plasmodium berghei]|uniref:Transcription elongation factor s-II, putative n=2 Tax=Plasmodium berghei TaxID=5821 RepID=A0A509AQ91_PLABA|nr:transcription elongation factor s-II, putative [Plasmodium berghei ANKA]CXJ16249.1 transcription elongation factor s-II, putative [Plasmodium berghei]SCM26303.1 transcription elongation factor s-II, putative [Plasmodium berghei]SCN28383.1 transcription elongation factor s-II, putative [Plasmodium berghei]SCO62579.1 transcription elongation factor s-II, putative [Plasmodium berghei]SCO64136.1 transcription elongation factor s-II, putative [Plasmodium berghei]|eukprot:XP_034424033.1 transcription elongation factor s-II, putative [Plasmodium berghei ANKA]